MSGILAFDRAKWVAVAMAVILGPYWSGRCLADGMFVGRENVGQSGKIVESSKQEAVLAFDGTTVRVILRSVFASKASDLAWVVPIPAKPENIKPAADSIFTDLNSLTAPQFYTTTYHSSLSCGCSAIQANNEPIPVRVEERGTAGIYKYVVLAADGAQPLAKWLESNGYKVPPGAEEIFSRYVAMKWHWLAMKIHPAASDLPESAPHPVYYEYKSNELAFPMAISKISAASQNEVILYILAAKRYQSANWKTIDIVDLRAVKGQFRKVEGSSSGTDYEKTFLAMSTINTGRLFVAEYVNSSAMAAAIQELAPLFQSSNSQLQILTRLRALASPQAMTDDIILKECNAGYIGNSIEVADSGKMVRAIAPLPIFAALCLGMVLMRKRRVVKVFGISITAVAAMAFAML